MKIIVFLILSVFSLKSFSGNWSVKLVLSDNEVKNYYLDEKPLKLYLPKTPWECAVSGVLISENVERRDLVCRLGDQMVLSALACPNQEKHSGNLQLVDSKKRHFRIRLYCNNEKMNKPVEINI